MFGLATTKVLTGAVLGLLMTLAITVFQVQSLQDEIATANHSVASLQHGIQMERQALAQLEAQYEAAELIQVARDDEYQAINESLEGQLYALSVAEPKGLPPSNGGIEDSSISCADSNYSADVARVLKLPGGDSRSSRSSVAQEGVHDAHASAYDLRPHMDGRGDSLREDALSVDAVQRRQGFTVALSAGAAKDSRLNLTL